MLDDQGWHADCRKDRPHVRLDRERQHEGERPWAERQTFHPCPSCPDLFVPRHVRIYQMLWLSCPPHADKRGAGFVSTECGSTRIRVTLEHDQRGGARRMCRREQRR